jgi:SAM-dependent methyltransferase
MFAQSYPEAKVLAVDLSLASLGYAKLKTREMGLANIEYAQADILELGGLGRTFDVISSGGVLHHLADMMAGWRVLLSLLRPGGCMHIALYSELARRSVVAGRNFIAQRGLSASDIPRARQELIEAAAGDPALQGVLEFPDFYARSDCRDLLFHVQESRCTLPQIAEFLAENNLEFLGFVLADSVRARFHARHGWQKDPDLNLWHAFETQNPDTFRGMYEFWIQRRS